MIIKSKKVENRLDGGVKVEHEEALNKILNFQLTNFSHADKHEAKIVKVAEPWQWYNNNRFVCKVCHQKYFDTIEGFPTYVRMMFLSVDDNAMCKNFFGELDEVWERAMKVYNSVPEVVDDEWFKENGFERF